MPIHTGRQAKPLNVLSSQPKCRITADESVLQESIPVSLRERILGAVQLTLRLLSSSAARKLQGSVRPFLSCIGDSCEHVRRGQQYSVELMEVCKHCSKAKSYASESKQTKSQQTSKTPLVSMKIDAASFYPVLSVLHKVL